VPALLPELARSRRPRRGGLRRLRRARDLLHRSPGARALQAGGGAHRRRRPRAPRGPARREAVTRRLTVLALLLLVAAPAGAAAPAPANEAAVPEVAAQPPRGAARLRGLPERLRGRLAIGDGEPDARHHPRAAGCGGDPRPGARLLRRQVRAVDPPLAAPPRLRPPRVGGTLHRPRRGTRGGGPGPSPLAARPLAGAANCPRARGARAHPARDGGARPLRPAVPS